MGVNPVPLSVDLSRRSPEDEAGGFDVDEQADYSRSKGKFIRFPISPVKNLTREGENTMMRFQRLSATAGSQAERKLYDRDTTKGH